ncbi:MAG: type II secretion system F family protein [Candidatus Aenigmarchaeota archaeon]|nr:type II secretion system F family protein [Candidatus Aenigmarchaeota archaeon]
MKIEIKKLTETQIFVGSLGVSTIMILAGIIVHDAGIVGNAIILSTFLIITPILFVRYKRYREFKEIEEKFPNFLRDIIESIRAGLPLHKAIVNTSRVNYGTLSREVKKMSNQISWGLSVDKVLMQFADRMKGSKRINAAIQVILESYLFGGDVVSTMETVADSQNLLLEVEREKTSTLNQYVIVMYAIALIFIGIVVAINKLIIPIFNNFQGSEFGVSNPCNLCVDFACTVCSAFEITSTSLFYLKPGTIGIYYTALFFMMSMVQAIFSGLVAGQISEGSFVAGLRHSLILASITFGTFSILVRVGLIGT